MEKTIVKTHKEKLVEIKEMLANIGVTEGEHVDEINHWIESVSKKRKPSKKDVERREANAELTKAIVAAMEVGKEYNIPAVKALVPELNDATPQKMSNLLKCGVDGKKLNKKFDGRTPTWSLC